MNKRVACGVKLSQVGVYGVYINERCMVFIVALLDLSRAYGIINHTTT